MVLHVQSESVQGVLVSKGSVKTIKKTCRQLEDGSDAGRLTTW